jgi:CTD small phosphatase-like protein 2
MFPQNDKMNINTYSFYLSKIQTTQINTLIEYYKKKINQNLYQTINNNNKIYKTSTYKQNQYSNKHNIMNIPYLSNKKDPKKYFTLVLDLDETLISYQKDEYGRGLIKTRPNLNLFLSEINKIYELIIFTAGTQEYADPILNIIDQKNCFFEKRLYRQHAIIIDNGFVKDLSLLGRDLKKVIIIDNNPLNYELQKENGIFIKSFYGEKDDNVLLELIPILKKIALKKDNDVRVELLRMKDEIFTKITTNLKK